MLRRAVLSARLRNAGQPELSDAARELLEAPVSAPDQQRDTDTQPAAAAAALAAATTASSAAAAGRLFAPRTGGDYSLLTVDFLCDLLRASGGADHCEHPTISEDQVKSLLDCISDDEERSEPRADHDEDHDDDAAAADEKEEGRRRRRRLQLATLKVLSLLSRAAHNHAALTEGETPGALVDLSTDETTHLDVRLASLSALDEMLGGGGALSWRESSTINKSGSSYDREGEDDDDDDDGDDGNDDGNDDNDDWRDAYAASVATMRVDQASRSRDEPSLERALREEDDVRRACLMRILAASAGQLSAYDPSFLSGMWLPPSAGWYTFFTHHT